MKQHSIILKSKLLLTIFLCISTLISCDHAEVDGVFIDHTLYENLTIPKQIELKKLIRKTLHKDETSLTQLNEFWCGGGAGCYDLGFILTQIIYRLGEDEFIKMVVKLDREKLLGLEGPDFKLKVSGLLQAQNTLEITVANAYRNRIIGDYKQYDSLKNVWTSGDMSQFSNKEKMLKPSGVMGPLQLMIYRKQ